MLACERASGSYARRRGRKSSGWGGRVGNNREIIVRGSPPGPSVQEGGGGRPHPARQDPGSRPPLLSSSPHGGQAGQPSPLLLSSLAASSPPPALGERSGCQQPSLAVFCSSRGWRALPREPKPLVAPRSWVNPWGGWSMARGGRGSQSMHLNFFTFPFFFILLPFAFCGGPVRVERRKHLRCDHFHWVTAPFGSSLPLY